MNNILLKSNINSNTLHSTRQVATMTNPQKVSKGINFSNMTTQFKNITSSKKFKIITILLIASIIFGLSYYYFFIYDPLSKYRVVILPKTTPRNTSKAKEKSVFPTKYGILSGDTEMTFSTWIKVEDFKHNYGLMKHIFSYSATGSSNGSPSIYMEPSDNTIVIDMTLVNDTVKRFYIHNIPIKRWFHLVITIAGDITHIYMNGELISSYALGAYIKPLPDGKFYFNSKKFEGALPGFGGKISKFEYFKRSLSSDDIYTVYREGNVSKKKPSKVNKRNNLRNDEEEEEEYEEDIDNDES